MARMFKTFATATLLAVVPVMAGVAMPTAAMAQANRARDPGAEAFVATGAQQVLGILNDRSLGIGAKEASFKVLIDRLVDVPKVTRFVLGKYARTITPDQYARFAVAFRNYAEAVYQKRISDYHGETVTVTGSVVRKPGDVLVTTSFGSRSGAPSIITWRVMGGGNSWKVVDVEVSGVWLAITQQQDFVSTIDNAGGNVDVLIRQLEADRAGAIHKS